MTEAENIDWDKINRKMPYKRNKKDKRKRKTLFKQFDPNGNGYLSLAEVRITIFIFFLVLFIYAQK